MSNRGPGAPIARPVSVRTQMSGVPMPRPGSAAPRRSSSGSTVVSRANPRHQTCFLCNKCQRPMQNAAVYISCQNNCIVCRPCGVNHYKDKQVNTTCPGCHRKGLKAIHYNFLTISEDNPRLGDKRQSQVQKEITIPLLKSVMRKNEGLKETKLTYEGLCRQIGEVHDETKFQTKFVLDQLARELRRQQKRANQILATYNKMKAQKTQLEMQMGPLQEENSRLRETVSEMQGRIDKFKMKIEERRMGDLSHRNQDFHHSSLSPAPSFGGNDGASVMSQPFGTSPGLGLPSPGGLPPPNHTQQVARAPSRHSYMPPPSHSVGGFENHNDFPVESPMNRNGLREDLGSESGYRGSTAGPHSFSSGAERLNKRRCTSSNRSSSSSSYEQHRQRQLSSQHY